MTLCPSQRSEERWYRFEQHELLVRAFWVKAPTLSEARQLVRGNKSGSGGIGVPDYAPDGPDSIQIKGRGKLEWDQELVDARADELEGAGGW